MGSIRFSDCARVHIVTTLVARLDNIGDVVLAGPAVRAVAAGGDPVVFLAGPRGAPAARMLPGIDEVLTFDAPWVPYEAAAVDTPALHRLIDQVREASVDEAVILTSYHQSPLPLALLLRQAGVGRIAATSVDYPGSLLDVRVGYDEVLHEVEQSLLVCAAAGHALPPGDDGRLQLDIGSQRADGTPGAPFVVVHPGASVAARALPTGPTTELITHLTMAGWHVVVTGTEDERALCEQVSDDADPRFVDLRCGRTSLADFVALLSAASVVVCGNTGSVHLAAAVGTPVVEAFAPVVRVERWRPWRVAHVLLGRLDIECAGCRERVCPVAGQPCLKPFTARAAMAAIEELTGERFAEPSAGAGVPDGRVGRAAAGRWR